MMLVFVPFFFYFVFNKEIFLWVSSLLAILYCFEHFYIRYSAEKLNLKHQSIWAVRIVVFSCVFFYLFLIYTFRKFLPDFSGLIWNQFFLASVLTLVIERILMTVLGVREGKKIIFDFWQRATSFKKI